jgi:pSer/pThr/pTyr-binding forkhead associated (FHA) protein
MYGGGHAAQKAAPYGATVAVNQAGPPDAYRPPGGGTRAVLTGTGGTYTVSPNLEMSVGRDAAKCHITLTEPRVSGVHATLKLDQGQLYVRDENSNNGTFVDGHRLSAGVWTVAPAGSSLKFGPAEFNIRIE